MSDIQIGELYLVKELFWLLFPTKELAGNSTGDASSMSDACFATKWLGERYKCNVCVLEPSMYFVLLEQEDEEYFKLLDCNGNVGWIFCYNFSRFFNSAKVKQ